MSMFDNYENLNSDYIPYNIQLDVPTRRNKYTNELPRKEFNKAGEFVGYSWDYGDTLILTFYIQPIVKVEENAIVYDVAGQVPLNSTVGEFHQRAYNTADLRVWVCETYDQTEYVWKEQCEFTYPRCGTKEIVLPIGIDLSQKKVLIELMNFRREVIHSAETDCAEIVNFAIDKELSDKLLEGIYYCKVTIFNDVESRFSSEYMLIVK